MRPTGLGYRSPRERTPAFYTTYVSPRFPAHLSNAFDTNLDQSKGTCTLQPATRFKRKVYEGVCVEEAWVWLM